MMPSANGHRRCQGPADSSRPRVAPPASGDVLLALRPQQAADALGISLRTLMLMVRAGEIPVARIGARSLRLPLEGLRTWLAARTTWPTKMVAAAAAEGGPVDG